MSPDETGRLLAFAGAYGMPEPDPAEVTAWHEALHPLDFDEAQFAVVLHYRGSTAHPMPADIWNRCRVPEAMAPVIPLRPRQAPDPERWHRMWEEALAVQAAACESRRAVVLGAKPPEDGTPPLSARLCEPPLGFKRPYQWNGYIPPEMFNGERNNSPRRAALLALVDDALDAEAGESQ